MTASSNSFAPFTLYAPAKINLYLHVTGKRSDGYHTLDSLTVFTNDLADKISFSPADAFEFSVDGMFAGAVPKDNLITRAVDAVMSERPAIHIHLEKNIPSGAGLGGGSADAAATIRALEKIYGFIAPKEKLLCLGADVPVCYEAKPCRFSGIGEVLEDIPALPALSIVVIWPNCHSATREVFDNRAKEFSKPAMLPKQFLGLNDFIEFLKTTGNDLTVAATSLNPDIQNAANFLKSQKGCLLDRMSGSGSAMFGLFSDKEAARSSLEACHDAHPDWFCRNVSVG